MKVNKNNILKVITMLIVSIMLMSQVSIAATTGVVNYDTVRVRKEPTTNSGIAALISIGDKVQVLEKSGDWYKITCEYEGKQVTGYVSGKLIDVKDDSQVQENNNTTIPEEPDTSTQEPEEEPSNENSDKNDEPTNSDVEEPIDQPDDSEDETNDPNNGKSEVILTTLKITEGQLTEDNTITLTSDVNIKILPVVNSTEIATITAGTKVTIVEVLNQWVRIETEEQIGWARID